MLQRHIIRSSVVVVCLALVACLDIAVADTEMQPNVEVGEPHVTTTTEAPRTTSVSLCEASASVPSTVQSNDSIWQTQQAPARDSLDDYMLNRTGCRYLSVSPTQHWMSLPDVTLEGAALQLQLAVRGEKLASFKLHWGNSTYYRITIGFNKNQRTVLERHHPHAVLGSVATPDILARDQYVPFYVTLEPERLTFGKSCSSPGAGPLLAHHITLEQRVIVQVEFRSYSSYGGKLLLCL